jgi:hypothetical protein
MRDAQERGLKAEMPFGAQGEQRSQREERRKKRRKRKEPV